MEFVQMTEFPSVTKCPFCGASHELATSISGAKTPSDGDISLCVGCGEFAFFEAGTAGGLRKPTDDEYTIIAESQILRASRAAWVRIVEKARR